MTFVQIEVEFFRVNSYFIDNLDTQNKQRQMRPLCGSLERFLDTKGHRYSKDVTTIEIVFLRAVLQGSPKAEIYRGQGCKELA